MTTTRQQHRAGCRTRRAFTLVEAAVSMVIVATMFVTSLNMIAGAAHARSRLAIGRRAELLARAMVAEVQQAAYGATTGLLALRPHGVSTDRTSWTTVDDYSGFSDEPPTARDGTALPGHAGWRRSVRVGRIGPTDINGVDLVIATDTGLKRIQVTVTAPGGEVLTYATLRSRWGLADVSANSVGRPAGGLFLGARPLSGDPPMYMGVDLGNLPGANTPVAFPLGAAQSGGSGPPTSGGLVGGLLRGLGL